MNIVRMNHHKCAKKERWEIEKERRTVPNATGQDTIMNGNDEMIETVFDVFSILN